LSDLTYQPILLDIAKMNINMTANVLHSKKRWVVSTQIWVKYGQTQMLG